VSGGDAPPFWKAHPELGLAAKTAAAVDRALKFDRNLRMVRSKSDDVLTENCSG